MITYQPPSATTTRVAARRAGTARRRDAVIDVAARACEMFDEVCMPPATAGLPAWRRGNPHHRRSLRGRDVLVEPEAFSGSYRRLRSTQPLVVRPVGVADRAVAVVGAEVVDQRRPARCSERRERLLRPAHDRGRSPPDRPFGPIGSKVVAGPRGVDRPSLSPGTGHLTVEVLEHDAVIGEGHRREAARPSCRSARRRALGEARLPVVERARRVRPRRAACSSRGRASARPGPSAAEPNVEERRELGSALAVRRVAHDHRRRASFPSRPAHAPVRRTPTAHPMRRPAQSR